MSRIHNIHQQAISEGRSTLTVACHNGKFHLDEIMCLIWLNAAGIEFSVTRTRDPKIIEAQDLAIDVSGRDEGRFFDHHQRGFERGYDNGVRMAACGLIWHDLKDVILDRICPKCNEDVRNAIREKIEQRLVIPTDAADTGTTGSLNPLTLPTLADVVGSFNSQNPNFQESSFQLCYLTIREIVVSMIRNWKEAIIEQDRILTQMRSQHGDILMLEEGGPWIELAVKNWDEFAHFQVAVYPDITNPDQWRIQSFPGSKENTFEQRCSAPENWKGLKTGDDYGTSFDDKMVFCHPAGFIGGVRGSREDAVIAACYWVQNHS